MIDSNKWAHQPILIAQVEHALENIARRVCAQLDTGGGKTICIVRLAENEIARGGRVVVYSSRRVIHDQIVETFFNQGVDVGVRAAGVHPALTRPVQISSIQTDYSRCITSKRWQLHDATLVLQDEAHSNAGPTAQAIHKLHYDAGAKIVGVTATPTELSHMYDHLIHGPSRIELRNRGVLVPCIVYAPTELDLSKIRVIAGEYDKKEVSRRLTQPVVFGDVIEHYRRINPDQRPTILFSPDVRSSRWFRDCFIAAGIPAAHVDGSTPQAERQSTFESVRTGQTKVLTSCGVLREGFDMPVISHLIMCQPCRKLKTWVQIVGRVLRAHPGKEQATMSDHAGTWLRHGSPNAEREWTLDEEKYIVTKKKRGQGEPKEPVCCPVCSQIRTPMPPNYDTCPCGYRGPESVRRVRMESGELQEIKEDPNKPKPVVKPPGDKKVIISAIFAGMHRNWKVSQIVAHATKVLGRRPNTKDCRIYWPSKGSYDWDTHARKISEWRWIRDKVAIQQGKVLK